MFYNDPIEISADMWAELFVDREITTEEDLKVLKIIYESENHEIKASQIAQSLGLSHGWTTKPTNKQV